MLHFFICLLVVMVGWTDYISFFIICYGRMNRHVTLPYLLVVMEGQTDVLHFLFFSWYVDGGEDGGKVE